MKKFIRMLASTILLTTLAGCVSTITATAQDNTISQTANNRIYQELKINNPSNIAVATQNNNVLIAGQVPTEELKTEITNLVQTIDGVKKVYNFLEVEPPVSMGTHLTDSWITTKIKTRFMADKNIDTSAIKIVTEDGTVFLIGDVTESGGKEAVLIAKSTDNVRQVVEIFEYIHLTESPEGNAQ